MVRGLSAKGEVVPELTQVAAEIAKVLAGAPSGGKASMVLASMVKESLDSSNTPASLAMAEVLAKATRLDEAWELLMRLDAKGIKDPDWMKKTFPVPPPLARAASACSLVGCTRAVNHADQRARTFCQQGRVIGLKRSLGLW